MVNRQHPWPKIASKILKAEMAKRGINYPELVDKLNALGISIKVMDLRSRLSKGTFSAALFIECLKAIGVKTLQLDDSFFDE